MSEFWTSREAEVWLRDLLREGAMPAEKAREWATEAGISARTLENARRALDVTSTWDNLGKPWWSLP